MGRKESPRGDDSHCTVDFPVWVKVYLKTWISRRRPRAVESLLEQGDVASVQLRREMDRLCKIRKFLSFLDKILGTIHSAFESGLRMLRRIDDIVEIFRNVNLCLVDSVIHGMNVFPNITLDLVDAFPNLTVGLVNVLVDVILGVVDGFSGGVDDRLDACVEPMLESLQDVSLDS